MGFDEALREQLDMRDISQAELARRMKLSQATTNAWATGAKRPEYPNAVKLEEVLDVRPRGRFLQMLGYAAPADGEAADQPSLEERIWMEEDISLADRRALVRFVTLARAEGLVDRPAATVTDITDRVPAKTGGLAIRGTDESREEQVRSVAETIAEIEAAVRGERPDRGIVTREDADMAIRALLAKALRDAGKPAG